MIIENKKKPTDWDQYYSKPFKAASITRKITEKRLIKLIKIFNNTENPKILEFGGANSCFAEKITYDCKPSEYSVADNNEYGLNLFKKKFKNKKNFQTITLDILNSSEINKLGLYDIILSAGLIEHFEKKNTAKSIQAHFRAVKPGGIVIITFPTPTKVYQIIRFIAEITNNWHFSDERPLQFDEVINVCSQFGTLLHKSTNWLIGLTQGIVVYKKSR